MGNALTDAEITRCLTEFQEAGFGGVEVSPIYGPRGAEDHFTEFLSPEWHARFAFTVREAERLNLGVDLIAGTGWPFGGPWVPAEDAARRVSVEKVRAGAEKVRQKNADATLLATQETDSGEYALFLAPTGQQVKRAAPGGAGPVLDHFDPAATRRYFAAMDGVATPRCFFNDSWEVFGANATPTILDEFQHRRGYDLRDHLREFAGEGDMAAVAQVHSDYRQTIHERTVEFLTIFREWAHAHGAKMRNQAHGSPGNLLDLYALADIPETEIFGPLRRLDPALPPRPEQPLDFGSGEEALICRFASSAAHVTGKPLCSSESFTWLGEHGHVPLSHMKAEADLLFCLGINHIFFHGTPYSPADAPWPGWLFYATTHCGPTNPFWRDLPTLNAYIRRCQEVLQDGLPDNDLLLYFPFYDLLASEAGAHDYLQFMTVGRTQTYLRGNLPVFVETARQLTEGGWSFDLVSDQQLRENVTPEGKEIRTTSGARYRAIVIAGCTRIPPEILERLAELAKAGVPVLFLHHLPSDVPGHADREARLERLREASQNFAGQTNIGADIPALLKAAGIAPEPVATTSLSLIRRRCGSETRYFVVNTGTEDVDTRFPLLRLGNHAAVVLTDPLTGEQGIAPVQDGGVRIALSAGASLLLRVGESLPKLPLWHNRIPKADAEALALIGPWTVSFVEGGPTLPPDRTLTALSDWTEWEATAEDEASSRKAFSGTARYTTVFDKPNYDAIGYLLDLGEVRHSAGVRLNGEPVGTGIAAPYRFWIPAERLLPQENRLEIEVTNLMANRLADLERREGERWRPFLMVNIHYKPFDAATWSPTPSGLLGPVRLVPLSGERE
ncbi:MAG: glycosyl hydrolase [Armatimonadaceae bacterium]